MGSRQRFLVVWLATLLSLPSYVVLFSSCQVSPNPKIDPLPTVKQIPLDVGIYYSPEFRIYEYLYEGYKISGDPADKESFAIGKASVDLLNQLLRVMFKNIVEIDQRPPLPSGSVKLAGVIEPNIEEFQLVKLRELPHMRQRYKIQMTYRFTLYTPDGELSVFWVSGEGKNSERRFASTSKIYRETTDKAMKNAGNNFATKFLDFPEVRRWLDKSGYPDAK